MKNLLIVWLCGVLIAGCKGAPGTIDTPNPTADPDLSLITPTRTVGSGTGDLTVDGQAMGIQPGEVVAIAPGTYKSLTFSNLTGTPGQRITLVARGLVEVIGGAFALNNVTNLTVTGGSVAKNLLLRDNAYRAITIAGTIPDGLTLQGFRLRNVADYALYYTNKATYDGSDATTLNDFKLLNCEFDNCGTVMLTGDLSSSPVVNTGFSRNPEVGYCAFTNSPTAGTVLFIGNTEGCNIHHNVVDNINANNDNHNGIFFVHGNGSVHHNKCTNHQGNFVRFWLFTQGSTPKEVLLYDNIVWNSRKYSALEVQSFAGYIIPGITTWANAKVFNNTAGKLNTTTPTVFVGVVVDVYNLYGGDLQLVNNLSFDQVKNQYMDGIWSQQSSTTPSVNTGNRYFGTASAAGLTDQTAFRLQSDSPAKGAGVYRSYLTDDFYGTKRTNPPSVVTVPLPYF